MPDAPAHPPATLDVEVFRAGDYGSKGRFAPEDLDAIVRDYDPARHEAPVTLDHLQTGPAHGWVAALRRVGDRLVATLSRLSPALRALLSQGSYRKRSIELYRVLRETGRPYLKAVSFLGAAAPEVKGLADPAFADGAPETIAFDEEHPTRDQRDEAARAARQRLVDARRWNPAWEDGGLLAVFAELGPGEPLDVLVNVLRGASSPVMFGETPRASAQAGEIDEFVGTPSPESVLHHQEALAYIASHPTVSYVEALLRTAR